VAVELALTFDDGPDPVDTPRLLALLGEHDVKATFFVWGQEAAKYPDVVREVIDAGHSVQPHCWAHTDHWSMTAEAIATDLDAVAKMLKELGADAPRCCRPPYGHLLPDATREIAARRLLALVGWDVTVEDWLIGNDAAALYTALRGDLVNHASPVVLMHDGHAEDGQTRLDASNTIGVVRRLLDGDEWSYIAISGSVEGHLDDRRQPG